MFLRFQRSQLPLQEIVVGIQPLLLELIPFLPDPKQFVNKFGPPPGHVRFCQNSGKGLAIGRFVALLASAASMSAFNFLEDPTDVVLLVVLWRLRYTLSLRDLAEMFLERGWEFTHEAVREWETRFAPLLAEHLRTKRRGQAGPSWYVDETSVRVKGKWCSVYRALDADGNLVDSRLSRKRHREAAQLVPKSVK